MTTETWLPVVEWEGIYEVSDMGQVRRVRRGSGATVSGIPMRGSIDRYGYPIVTLSDRGRRANAKVHRLVATAFLGSLPEGEETRHINGDPSDARLSNLAYGTHVENMRDMVEHGRSRSSATHCPHDHPYDDANTYVDHRGARNCRICMTASAVATARRARASRRQRGEDYWFNVRQWGLANGYKVAATGRLSIELMNAYQRIQRSAA